MNTKVTKRYLYKYVLNGQIIYIGKTINVHHSIRQHKGRKDLPLGCEIYVGECQNSASQYAFEALLIDHYRPAFNTSFICNDEPVFNGGTLWEPEWILYDDFCKKEQGRIACSKQPTQFQKCHAREFYRSYESSLDTLLHDSPWEAWWTCVLDHKDFYPQNEAEHFSVMPWDSFTKTISNYDYSEGECISWKILWSWIVIKTAEVRERYDCYYGYAVQRGIETQPFLLQEKYSSALMDSSQVSECIKTVNSYIKEIEQKIQKQRNAVIKKQEALQDFVRENQPLYINTNPERSKSYSQYGCQWDSIQQRWYVSERTHAFFKNPIRFFNRMAPEDIAQAITMGALEENELSSNARVAYRVYLAHCSDDHNTNTCSTTRR